jgi:hypothetical protein
MLVIGYEPIESPSWRVFKGDSLECFFLKKENKFELIQLIY